MSNQKTSWEDIYSGRTQARGDNALFLARLARQHTETLPVQSQLVSEIGAVAMSSTEHIPEPANQTERTHTGFETEPGIPQNYDKYYSLLREENPRHY